ncbi:GNAT family N-acetyltransferase [Kocuria arenosa]|uniref:GNAT family N-acetyltransferase n=1 Tax=Kocuria arenosa TaxID=3071446 RepID=UPI0034D4F52B
MVVNTTGTTPTPEQEDPLPYGHHPLKGNPVPRPATAADLPRLADVLADAFSDYAWTNWTVPTQGRHQRIRTLQLLYLRHAGLPHGMVWTVPDRTAVAAFLPAPLPPLPPAVLEQITDTHGDRLKALMEAEELVAARRPAHDWVLATVGVAPTAQGHGLGRTVVTAGLEAIDGQGGTCLLETSDPRNLPIYQRFGFTVDAVVTTPGPPVWIMTRTN